MTVKRQLLNFGGRSVDFRLGENAIDELSSLARGAVGRPRRAALVLDGTLGPERELVVARSLEDAGFEVRTHAVPAGPKSVDDAVALMDLFAADAITSEDLIVGAGAIHTMGLVSFSAKLWCGGAQSLLVPSTLDAMVIAATSALPLSTPGSSGMVELRPKPTMVVADLSLAEEAGPEANAAGFTLMVATPSPTASGRGTASGATSPGWSRATASRSPTRSPPSRPPGARCSRPRTPPPAPRSSSA